MMTAPNGRRGNELALVDLRKQLLADTSRSICRCVVAMAVRAGRHLDGSDRLRLVDRARRPNLDPSS
jgi:hypothetical protein